MKRERPLIMGILNVTPDSFSDGGEHFGIEKALKRAQEMIVQGADIIDIGGESTGPGSVSVSLEEELKRVLPVVRKNKELRIKDQGFKISVDTHKAEVARQALEAGADMVNDVTALRGDPEMAHIIAEHKCSVVLMYAKDKSPRTTRKKTRYQDIMQTILDFFEERIAFALGAGIRRNKIILDPGMGAFISAIPRYSFEIIARLDELKRQFGLPILVGPSRKSFLGGKMDERLEGGLAVSCLAYEHGASIIRTHDVLETRRALDTSWHVMETRIERM